MKSEVLLKAIGKIEDELVLAAVEAPDEKTSARRKGWMKWGALAACLCLFLVIPVAAATKSLLVQFYPDRTGWEIDWNNKERIAVADFSENVQKFLEELGNESQYIDMESLEKAEEFLGVEVPDNVLLTEAIKDELHIETEVNGQKKKYDSHCLVRFGIDDDGKLLAVNTKAAYRYKKLLVQVTYQMKTEENVWENGGGFGGMNFEGLELQHYTTPSGRECTIFYDSFGVGNKKRCSGYGYVYIDGVLIELNIMYDSERMVQKSMIELLDAFE